MKQVNALLIAYEYDYADSLKEKVKIEGINILTAVTLEEVKRVFEDESINVVMLGSDKENLETRMQIIEHIANLDIRPSIHFQGVGVDTIPWVHAILESTLLN